MKYIEYVVSVFRVVFDKIFGLVWPYVVIPFRGYARGVVHSYTLENGFACKRLMERRPTWDGHGWILHDVHGVGRNGYVGKRDVSWLKYWLVKVLVWKWLDDDSNEDTFAKGHSQEYIDGKRKWPVFNSWLVGRLKKEVEGTTYGNTFDLGDYRAESPNFRLMSTILWNTRNVAQNSAYLDDVTCDESKIFQIKILNMIFGWEKDDALVNGVQYYIRRIGTNF